MMFFSATEIMHFAVPFVFTFAVIYGLLSTMPKSFPKNANVLIAAAFGLVTSIYEPTAILIFDLLPFATVILVLLFIFVFIKKILGIGEGGGQKTDTGTTLAILGISLLALAATWNQLSGFMQIDASLSSDMQWILGLAFVGLILYAGTRQS